MFIALHQGSPSQQENFSHHHRVAAPMLCCRINVFALALLNLKTSRFVAVTSYRYRVRFRRPLYSTLTATAFSICALININRPSKPDSAPVRGDGYEPAGLRIQQSQRRNVRTAAQRRRCDVVVVQKIFLLGG